MPSETLLRWILDGGSQISRFREKERIVNQAVIPLLANGAVVDLVSDYLVSKRRGSEVWLTVFTQKEHIDELRPAVESHLYEYPWRFEQGPADDPFLDPKLASYRHRLREVTDVALDLHGDPNLVEHQMFLIQVACGTDDNARELNDFLCQYSPTYAAFPEHHKIAFWNEFTQPAPQPGLPVPILYFWNIVLGCEPAPGGNPAAVADLIGIA
jgi:hypothetical protein